MALVKNGEICLQVVHIDAFREKAIENITVASVNDASGMSLHVKSRSDRATLLSRETGNIKAIIKQLQSNNLLSMVLAE